MFKVSILSFLILIIHLCVVIILGLDHIVRPRAFARAFDLLHAAAQLQQLSNDEVVPENHETHECCAHKDTGNGANLPE